MIFPNIPMGYKIKEFMLISFIQYFLPFSLLLGTLVFIHELGHFLAARYFGVRVEVFSLGFGPKLFQFKKGDTVYCISLIPLGGYVKMFGDNPKKRIEGDEKKYAFLSQQFWPKMIIALAGPLMNLLLAVLLFSSLSFIGKQKAKPFLGEISKKSQAYLSGFRSNDKIISINGKQISYWEEAFKWIEKNPEKPLQFMIERDSQNIQIKASPKKVKNTKLTVLSSFVGEIKGLTSSSPSSHIGIKDKKSLSYKYGLRTFDKIIEFGGKKILNWGDLSRAAESLLTASSISITVERESSEKKFTTVIPFSPPLSLKNLGIESTELYVDRIKKGSPADTAGLMKKDRLFKFNGQAVNKWEDFSSLVSNYEKHPEPFTLSILREGVEEQLTVHTEKMPVPSLSGQIEYRYMIGVASAQYLSHPPLVKSRTLNPFKALSYGVKEALKWTAITGKVLWKLVTGNISHRIIGGPISIAKASKNSLSAGLTEFLAVMAIISINLFLMNLLPIPVLDGGHLLLFTIEAIKGKTLSPQKIELVQMGGFFIILFFILLTFINDIGNWNLIW